MRPKYETTREITHLTMMQLRLRIDMYVYINTTEYKYYNCDTVLVLLTTFQLIMNMYV